VVKGLNIIVTSTKVQWVCTYKSPKEDMISVMASLALAKDSICIMPSIVLAAVAS
jgi:hypothetical protein